MNLVEMPDRMTQNLIRSIRLNEEGLFNIEYVDIFDIPFEFAAKPVVALTRASEASQIKDFYAFSTTVPS